MFADFLARLFIKNYEDVSNPIVRDKYAKMTNIVFMAFMASMGVVKFFIGTVVGSLAITSSSFADFSDIGLGLMMMISVILANRKPDEKHPFGYARIEYIAGMIVSLVVLLLGVQLMTSSIGKIMNPVAPEATIPAYVIMIVSVAVNFIVFFVNRRVASIIGSVTIKAAATKNVVDGIASAVVVASLAVFGFWGIDLDGYVGLLMSLLIIYSALMSLNDTVRPLLGLVPDLELSEKIKNKILAYPNILGLHNLIIHNYGNNRCYVSVHAELSEQLSAIEIHQVICDIEQDFMFEGIILTVHFDLVQDDDALTQEVKSMLNNFCKQCSYNPVISDLKIMPTDIYTYLFFTVTIPQRSDVNAKKVRNEFIEMMESHNKGYKAAITVSYHYVNTNMNS